MALKTAATAALMMGACLAHAQSTVDVYGVMDLFVAHGSAGDTSWTRLSEGGNAASRLGFRGREDLGGGLDAHFLLESGIAADTGVGTIPGPAYAYTRQSFVGLGAPWGAVDLGRMYTPMFYSMFGADPFGLNSVFSPMNLIAVNDAQTQMSRFAARSSNMVRYRTPVVGGGFQGSVAYAPGEVATPFEHSGEFYGASLSWVRKPYYVAYGFQRVRAGSAQAPEASPAATTYQSLSGAYTFGGLPLQVFATYATAGSSLAGVPRMHLYDLGAKYSLGALTQLIFEVTQRKVQSSERGQVAWTLGLDHDLSKRTVVYARLLGLRNDGGSSVSVADVAVRADSGDSISVIAAGIRHSF